MRKQRTQLYIKTFLTPKQWLLRLQVAYGPTTRFSTQLSRHEQVYHIFTTTIPTLTEGPIEAGDFRDGGPQQYVDQKTSDLVAQ